MKWCKLVGQTRLPQSEKENKNPKRLSCYTCWVSLMKKATKGLGHWVSKTLAQWNYFYKNLENSRWLNIDGRFWSR